MYKRVVTFIFKFILFFLKLNILKFLLLLISTFIIIPCHSQERVITGRVLGKHNNPLPGVNITVKGTVNGTITDADGKFNLKVNSTNSIIVVSYIGIISQEFSVANQSTLVIILDKIDNDQKYWCCTDHIGPNGPHCDTDKNVLRKEFKCKKFERQ